MPQYVVMLEDAQGAPHLALSIRYQDTGAFQGNKRWTFLVPTPTGTSAVEFETPYLGTRMVMHFTYDGSTVRAYEDGVPLAPTGLAVNTVGVTTGQTLYVGNTSDMDASPYYFIDYLAFYGVALSASEVAAHAVILRADDDRK